MREKLTGQSALKMLFLKIIKQGNKIGDLDNYGLIFLNNNWKSNWKIFFWNNPPNVRAKSYLVLSTLLYIWSWNKSQYLPVKKEPTILQWIGYFGTMKPIHCKLDDSGHSPLILYSSKCDKRQLLSACLKESDISTH